MESSFTVKDENEWLAFEDQELVSEYKYLEKHINFKEENELVIGSEKNLLNPNQNVDTCALSNKGRDLILDSEGFSILRDRLSKSSDISFTSDMNGASSSNIKVDSVLYNILTSQKETESGEVTTSENVVLETVAKNVVGNKSVRKNFNNSELNSVLFKTQNDSTKCCEIMTDNNEIEVFSSENFESIDLEDPLSIQSTERIESVKDNNIGGILETMLTTKSTVLKNKCSETSLFVPTDNINRWLSLVRHNPTNTDCPVPVYSSPHVTEPTVFVVVPSAPQNSVNFKRSINVNTNGLIPRLPAKTSEVLLSLTKVNDKKNTTPQRKKTNSIPVSSTEIIETDVGDEEQTNTLNPVLNIDDDGDSDFMPEEPEFDSGDSEFEVPKKRMRVKPAMVKTPKKVTPKQVTLRQVNYHFNPPVYVPNINEISHIPVLLTEIIEIDLSDQEGPSDPNPVLNLDDDADSDFLPAGRDFDSGDSEFEVSKKNKRLKPVTRVKPAKTTEKVNLDNHSNAPAPVPNIKKYKCKSCDFTSNLPKPLKLHIKTQHSTPRSFPCEDCEFKTQSIEDYQEHVRVTHNKDFFYNCKSCGFETVSKSDLIAHVKKHKCRWCRFRTSDLICMRDHVKEKHREAIIDSRKTFDCDSCYYRAENKADLKTHRSGTHTKKVYDCLWCSYTSMVKDTLNEHMFESHSLKSVGGENENRIVVLSDINVATEISNRSDEN